MYNNSYLSLLVLWHCVLLEKHEGCQKEQNEDYRRRDLTISAEQSKKVTLIFPKLD